MTAVALTERQFQQQVTDYATLRKWLWYHTHDSRRSPSGFPDLVLVRWGRVLYAELKSQAGRTTATQDRWLDELVRAGCMVYLWRPSDFKEIERVLA